MLVYLLSRRILVIAHEQITAGIGELAFISSIVKIGIGFTIRDTKRSTSGVCKLHRYVIDD